MSSFTTQILGILNAMQLVSSIKALLQKPRECGWNALFEKVKSFSEDHDIEVPDLNSQHKVDSLLYEMNSRFSDNAMEFMALSFALDLYWLVNIFYLNDFTELEKKHLKIQFDHFELDAH
ncbi:zinc finger MYM-type protein 1-like [Gossypium australe]|uniref:Zinc finger MYM-type protein 1-like n=1 Tax=Gossypium australe TaxID=47621 RepID=A0A5B6WY00_9ROSI|nr:zinc finger MYM-type protein 1-like [Gossypium australe]